jgi:hypothetical protein
LNREVLMRAFALLLASGTALAHDGHGLAGSHPHGWSAGPLALVAVMAVAGAVWLWKGRK